MNICKLQKTGEVGKKVFATPLHFPLAGFQNRRASGPEDGSYDGYRLSISIKIYDMRLYLGLSSGRRVPFRVRQRRFRRRLTDSANLHGTNIENFFRRVPWVRSCPPTNFLFFYGTSLVPATGIPPHLSTKWILRIPRTLEGFGVFRSTRNACGYSTSVKWTTDRQTTFHSLASREVQGFRSTDG